MAKIFVYDEFSPQDTAMLQALYSRSPLSVEEHVEKVRATGSGKFMEKFYVGYGHASIADCGSTTVFIEQLSILADKAIQDWPLYSGQETSTRYVDMAKQPIIDPLSTSESKKILDNWMEFYTGSQEKVRGYLKEKYPRKNDENENIYPHTNDDRLNAENIKNFSNKNLKNNNSDIGVGVYDKAINARSFDILRGFLPAGITTQLSWHTNLRQAFDKLSILRHNPLPEVKVIAKNILEKLKEKYPQSFSHPEIPEQEKYREEFCEKYNFFSPENHPRFEMRTNISESELNKYSDILKSRPEKTGLPHFMAELGTITFNFWLDYGSFRDIQRHRNGVCRMPLLDTQLGFNKWYLEQLPDDLQKTAKELIEEQKKNISALEAPPEIKQYYTALGFNVPCRATYGLPATVYVVELRSSRYVHPTLRKIAMQMCEALLEKFPELKLNCDMESDDWDARRGLHDIEIK
jgi:thymidylate synthase ThyX